MLIDSPPPLQRRSIYFMSRAMFVNDGATNAAVGAAPDIVAVSQTADAATSGVYWNFVVPADWSGGPLQYAIYWTPGATDGVAHTVQWSTDTAEYAAGAAVGAAGVTTAWTGSSAARTTAQLVIEPLQTLLVPVLAGNLVKVNIRRLGADALDTYVGTVNIVGVRVDYASLG